MNDFNSKQASWLDAIGAPIETSGTDGTGVDPRYGEHFSQIKSQIENKGETNYELILLTSIEVLAHEGKDLRVACYLWFAATRLQGAQGFQFGLDVMTTLLANYSDAIHPTKANARKAALNWIAQDRVIHFIESYGGDVSAERLAELGDAYDVFCQASAAVIEDGFRWTKFSNWLQNRQKSKAPVRKSASKPAPSAKVATPSEIQSDTQLTQVLRNIASYYKKSEMYGTYTNLNRTVRWSDLQMPPANDGLTRVPAPAASDHAKIENLMNQGQWMDAWLACEDAFMSPGGLFHLDYQRLAHQSAQRAGLDGVAIIIESQLRALLKRLPKLTSLHFSDESPFASSLTQGWIEQTLTMANEASESTADPLSEARELAQNSGLTEALKWLAGQPYHGDVERIRLNLMQGQLCIENDQSKLALPLLEKLSEEILEYRLQVLEPSLALQVWRQLQFALEHQVRRTRGAEDKAIIKQQIQQVNRQICSTDITMASQWL